MRLALCTIAFALIAPGGARALNCVSPTPIACGDAVSGNSFSMSMGLSNYSCLPYNEATEVYYLLALDSVTDVTIRLTRTGDAWNPALALLPEAAGDCDPAQCIRGSTSGSPITISAQLDPGTYYIVVDGASSILDYGTFDLSVTCLTCDNCVDDDGDGYPGYDLEDCFCGDDCCDLGTENSPGCDAQTRSSINPGAFETCDDGVDQDCDGSDDACPACGSDVSLACDDASTATTADGAANLDDYCGLAQGSWAANEYIFNFTPTVAGAIDFTTGNTSGQQLDVFALRNYGLADVCNPGACLDFSVQDGEDQRVVFYTHAGESYFISVDGRNGAQGSFDYTVACLTEECAADDVLICGSDIIGDNSNGTASLSAYPDVPGRKLAPEFVYDLTTGDDAQISLTLNVDGTAGAPPDLALLVLSEAPDSACLPENLLTYSDLVQDQSGNPPETVEFLAAADTTYYVVVDGQQVDSTGAYTLLTVCNLDCAANQTPCQNTCVNLNIDPSNCGFCGNTCFFDHSSSQCLNGTCTLGNCHSGWGNCNGDAQDGCEIRLGTIDNCADCGDVCFFVHAEPWCENGECLLLSCHAGWGNCNGNTDDGCEADLNTREYCGSCDNTCIAPQVCHDGNCLDECPAGFTDCSGSCADTDTSASHCGGCDQACTVANGLPACQDGSCIVGQCFPGYGDCENGYTDGCETDLTTPENCGECGHACSFDHATALCSGGSCLLGDCIPPWDNCNFNASDGCEINLDTNRQNCGECQNACPADQNCFSGQCSFQCIDNDNDGHESQDCGGDDCDDFNAGVYPDAQEICGDGIDQDCDGKDQACDCDDDGDGFDAQDCGGDDCDDTNGFINPDAEDFCGDGIDQDCDGEDLECTCQDADGDEYPDVACGGNDCDDNDHSVYPGAYEECGDGIDQDCNGRDEECPGGCGCATDRSASPAGLLLMTWLLIRRGRRKDLT